MVRAWLVFYVCLFCKSTSFICRQNWKVVLAVLNEIQNV